MATSQHCFRSIVKKIPSDERHESVQNSIMVVLMQRVRNKKYYNILYYCRAGHFRYFLIFSIIKNHFLHFLSSQFCHTSVQSPERGERSHHLPGKEINYNDLYTGSVCEGCGDGLYSILPHCNNVYWNCIIHFYCIAYCLFISLSLVYSLGIYL